MNRSGIQSQSFLRVKPIDLSKKISRCPSSASLTTRCSSSASNKTVKASIKSKPPRISSSSYCVYNMSKGIIISSKRDLELREIASLTKIMTAYTVLNLIDERKIIEMSDIVKVSKNASNVTGTSAGLVEGDCITVRDLLYGLMLPSGNDAAWALAEYCGKKLGIGNTVNNFLNEMNYNTKKIGLYYTTYSNPHGLSIRRNLSTARDVCKLATAAMKNKNFQRIVSTKSYTACIQRPDGTVFLKTWDNTNKLLEKGWTGIKTGVTTTAGPCLCSSYDNIVVTLLNSNTMDCRWTEAEALVHINSK